MNAPCSSWTILISPCMRSTRPSRQTVRSMSSITLVPASSSTISAPATVRFRDISPLPLTRSPCGRSSSAESSTPTRSLRCRLRARTSRFLRKSVRSLRFFFAMRKRPCFLPVKQVRRATSLVLTSCWLGRTACDRPDLDCAARVHDDSVRRVPAEIRSAFLVTRCSLAAGQRRRVPRDRNPRGTCAWRRK